MQPIEPIHIIGGGLAGSEAAWRLAEAGVEEVMLSAFRRGLSLDELRADVAAVRAAGERLNAVLDQQRRRVQAAKEVSERMLRAVTQEVERQKTPYQTYNRAATYSKPGRKAQVAAPTALAFHEVV